jgi:hypothetical protein
VKRRLGAALLLLAGLAPACRSQDPTRACPARFAPDPPRAAALVEALRAAPEGAALLGRAPSPFLCFGPARVSSVTTDQVVLFDADLRGAEAAARLGHLVEHLAEGLPLGRVTDEDCAVQVDRALAAEARALALELRLRRALGAPSGDGRRLPFTFEDAFWAAPEDRREALVLADLRAHPDGGPGLDALASGYARRCADVVRERDPR